MSNENEKPEVIDPDDPRYKDDAYFRTPPSSEHQSDFGRERRIKYYSFGGCLPLGCGCLPFFIIVAFLITWLLNLMH